MKSKLLIPLIVLSLWALGPTLVQATPITGTLQITGDATVSATVLQFLCTLGSPTPCPANTGNFAATGTQTGDFVPYQNEGGYIRSINQASQPINQNFLLSNFLVFAASPTLPTPDIALDLNFIYTGSAGQANCANPTETPGQTCTPVIPALVTAANPLGLSPFNLANTVTGSTASFSVAGTSRRLSTGETSPFLGTFTAQFTHTPGQTNKSFQDILAQLSTGGSITSSYSSTFNVVATAIPEPGTTGLMIGGLVLMAGGFFRRQKAQR